MVIVRGGGDIATGTIYRLYQCGYKVLILETDKPTAIRRRVAFCEAVYDGTATVEGVTCRRVNAVEQLFQAWDHQEIPLMIDPWGKMIEKLHPHVVIDAILAKKNLGTNRNMASLTIALGPGFCAGEDVDYVVETMRGHQLGRILSEGFAIPNTGIPGMIGGYGAERVIHAPAAGEITVYTLSLIHIFLGLEEKTDFVYETDVEAAAAKKGILVHSADVSNEEQRCLECNHICENCVDVCPNRANVAIRVPGSAMPAIVHVDYMCNECGNCKSFCPYSSAPYKDKFTLFADEADFENSTNDGYTVLNRETMEVKVRIGNAAATYCLTDEKCMLYDGLKQVILAIDKDYSYLYL